MVDTIIIVQLSHAQLVGKNNDSIGILVNAYIPATNGFQGISIHQFSAHFRIVDGELHPTKKTREVLLDTMIQLGWNEPTREEMATEVLTYIKAVAVTCAIFSGILTQKG